MLRRVIGFAAAPFALSLGLFPLFWYLRVVQDVEVPVWAVYIVSGLGLGGSLLGISYGVLSASWDPSVEGSRAGWTELRGNLPALMARMQRKDR